MCGNPACNPGKRATVLVKIIADEYILEEPEVLRKLSVPILRNKVIPSFNVQGYNANVRNIKCSPSVLMYVFADSWYDR